jgi:hypothetical protein
MSLSLLVMSIRFVWFLLQQRVCDWTFVPLLLKANENVSTGESTWCETFVICE